MTPVTASASRRKRSARGTFSAGDTYLRDMPLYLDVHRQIMLPKQLIRRLPFLFLTMSASVTTNDNAGSPIKELSGTCEPSCCTLSPSAVNPTF